jgi:Ca2+-binding RTX toxin-like protein
MLGGAGNDDLRATGGRDSLFGGAGNDTVISDSVIDRLFGGNGTDTLVLRQTPMQNFIARDAALVMSLTNGTTLTGFEAFELNFDGTGRRVVTRAGDDVLQMGGGNDTVSAGGGNDVVFAGDGTDSIAGGAGNDTLSAGGGLRDTLDGGAGIDVLYVDKTNSGANHLCSQRHDGDATVNQ